MVADWGTQDPAIGKLLDQLQGSRQLPFLAIFPAGHPEKAITISGMYKRPTLLEKLKEAGPSKNAPAATAPAEPKVSVAEEQRSVIRMSRLP